MDGQWIFPCKSKSGQETVYHCYAAAKRNRPASHGTCAGWNHAGYPDPVSRECRAMKHYGSRELTMQLSLQRLRLSTSWKKEGIDKTRYRPWGILKNMHGHGRRSTAEKIINQLKKTGCFRRLGERTLHNGWGMFQGSTGSIYQIIWKRLYLQGFQNYQLVSCMPDFHLWCRGWAWGSGRIFLAH